MSTQIVLGDRMDRYMDKIGTGLNIYGKYSAVSGAVVGVVVGLVMMAIGIFFVRDKHTGKVLAKVKEMFCPDGYHSQRCTYVVTYTVGAQNLTSTFEDKPNKHAVNSNVTLYYDPSNPLDVNHDAYAWRWMGWFLILLGLAVPAISIWQAMNAMKSSEFATIVGAQKLGNIVF